MIKQHGESDARGGSPEEKPMSGLDEARKEINRIDREMAELFAERMEAASRIAAYKRQHGLPVTDPEREREVIARNADRIGDPVLREYYVSYLNDMMRVSRAYQTRLLDGMKIAYSGTEGAFAHIAAGKIFSYGQRIPYGSFRDAYRAVAEGECDCAVLPLENSYAGEVGQVTDLLFSGTLYINGVYDLPVEHDLVGLPGAALTQIRTVVSHPQALSQCAEYIRRRGFGQLQYENTAMAAEYIAKKKDPSLAAICSRECAEIFGLTVLEAKINESRSNTTRFGVFTRAKCRITDNADDPNRRFILMFTVRNQAGSLAEAINIIGRHGYNMTTLRSRPMKELMWNYYFYIECEGVPDRESGDAMLEELSCCCDRLKLAGAYRPVPQG